MEGIEVRLIAIDRQSCQCRRARHLTPLLFLLLLVDESTSRNNNNNRNNKAATREQPHNNNDVDDDDDSHKPREPVVAAWTRLTHQYIHTDVPRAVTALSLVAVRRPRTVIVSVLILAIGLMLLGLVTNFEVNTSEFEIFSPFGVRPEEHGDWAKNQAGFPVASNAFIVLAHADGQDVLQNTQHMRRLFEVLQAIQQLPGYDTLCAQSSYTDRLTQTTTCQISSPTRFWNHNATLFAQQVGDDAARMRLALSADEYPDGIPVDHDGILGHPQRSAGADSDIITAAVSYSLVFLLPVVDEDETAAFEEAALEQVFALQQQEQNNNNNGGSALRLEVFADRSYPDEFQRAIVKDLPLIPLVFVVMALFTCSIFFRRDRVESRVLLGLGAVLTVCMSLLSGYGLMFLTGT